MKQISDLALRKIDNIKKATMNIWDKEFYKERKIYSKKIFQTPHRDIKMFIKLLKEIKAKNVLDLGCGTGRHTIVLAEAGFNVYGFDISKKALKFAKEQLSRKGLSAQLKFGDMHKPLPYKDNFFNGIISIKAFHHAKLSQIKKLIKEMKRVMGPEAILMIEVPRLIKAKSIHTKYKKIGPQTFVPIEGPEKGVIHYFFANKNQLKKLFSNFEIISIQSIGGFNFQKPGFQYTMFAKLKKGQKPT